MALGLVACVCCTSQPQAVRRDGFPDFVTTNENYYVTRIGQIPEIDPQTYTLEVVGLIDNPLLLGLEELYAMQMEDLPLTIECIGNATSGSLLSTAVWSGFRLYDLLQSLGLQEGATGVRYEAADGYYASHTIDQVRTNGVLVALYMNGVPIPPQHGFPIRILNPGYFGVKQPAWVTRIEVIDRPLEDYWEDRGWDCSPPMDIDSVVFAPRSRATVEAGQPLRITGAAFGGTRVAKVELTVDKGTSWSEARIVEQMDADNVWVFWEAEITFSESGAQAIHVRATDIHGRAQPESDPDSLDGANKWTMIRVSVQ